MFVKNDMLYLSKIFRNCLAFNKTYLYIDNVLIYVFFHEKRPKGVNCKCGESYANTHSSSFLYSGFFYSIFSKKL